ncbi:MAG: hypothetical protein LQ338_006798 [Usnochroma carphineum]|nr:MAG: hypothetical protein LQ338_006798 [Usnochroma carphineum]
MSTINPPKALLFDVFGTLVDWRTTVSYTLSHQAALALNSPSSPSLPPAVRLFASTISWPDFAQEWRDTYKSFTKAHSSPSTAKSQGKSAFKTVDQHNYDSLVRLLAEHNLTGLWDADQLYSISRIWHFLDPWVDTSPALHDLSKSFVLCTLSNANVALLRDLAHHADLPFSRILSAEHFGAYKPSPAVYNGAAEHLGLQSSQCALVAAHLGDLKAARECGFQTIYVERVDEEDWSVEQVGQARREGWVDMWIGLEDRRCSALAGLCEVRGRFLGAGSGYFNGGIGAGGGAGGRWEGMGPGFLAS